MRAWASPILREVFLAGLAGGLAMVPFGMAARLLGASVNVYGELMLLRLVGHVSSILLLIEHLLLSWVMAIPLVIGLHLASHRLAVIIGLGYGAATWLVVNSLALPMLFGQPTPWQIGWSAIWGSLLVHLVFGGVVAAESRRFAREGAGPRGRQRPARPELEVAR